MDNNPADGGGPVPLTQFDMFMLNSLMNSDIFMGLPHQNTRESISSNQN